MFGLEEKARRLAAGESPNPFIDPAGYRAFVAQSEQVYRQRLNLQGAAAAGKAGAP